MSASYPQQNLYRRAALLGDEGARAAFAAALRHGDDDLARTVLGLATVPDDVLEAARACPRPAVQAAWLLRPGRTRDELVAAVDQERRGEVLAAVARATDDTELRRRLARTGKRPVALALAGSDDDEVLAGVLVTLDRWLGSPKVPHEATTAAATALGSISAERLAALVPELGSQDLLAKVVDSRPSDRAVLSDLVARFAPGAAARFAAASWPRSGTARSSLAALINNPYMTRRQLLDLAAVLDGAGRMCDELAARARDLAAERDEDAPDLAALVAALGDDDPEVVRAAWGRCAGAQRSDLAPTVAANPAAPVDVLCEAVQARTELFGDLAHVADTATCVYVAMAGRAGPVLRARPELRDEVVAGIVGACRYPWQLSTQVPYLTVDELLDAPWHLVDGCSVDKVYEVLVDAFAGRPQAWEMLETLSGSWPGTVRQLVETCAAAVV